MNRPCKVYEVSGIIGRKWSQVLLHSTYLIFVVSLASYCQVSPENRETNCLHASMELFESVLKSSAWVTGTLLPGGENVHRARNGFLDLSQTSKLIKSVRFRVESGNGSNSKIKVKLFQKPWACHLNDFSVNFLNSFSRFMFWRWNNYC